MPNTKTLAGWPNDIPSWMRAVSKESFRAFVKFFWGQVPGAGKIIWNWHLDVFCQEMQKAAERVFAGQPREYDLVFNQPFGTSKSSVLSILFNAWVWTRMPQARFLTGTHTDKLALDFSTKTRCVVVSDLYRACFPEIQMRSDQDTKEYFANTLGGDRNTCTVGGKTPMGFHAHFLICDDPIDPQGAQSDVELDNADRFMTDVLPSRKVDKSISLTVLVMQRIHYRDPTSVMLREAKKEGAAAIRHICLPGELFKNGDGSWDVGNVQPPKLASQYQDGLLDVHRLSRSVLNEYRARGELFYATQILQRPYPPGGGMFKVEWFNNRVKAAPYHAKRVRFWDRAATQGAGCRTAGVLMAMTTDPLAFYVEDVVLGQWEPNERNARMRAAALRDRLRYGQNEPLILVEAEGGSSGKDAWKSVARALVGFPAFEQRVTGKKDTRAEPWAAQLAAGNVYLVDDGRNSWDINEYIQEHIQFRPEPGKRLGRFLDEIDGSSGAFNWLIGSGRTTTGFRILPVYHKRKEGLRIAVLSPEELENYQDGAPSLLTYIEDPRIQDLSTDSISETVEKTGPGLDNLMDSFHFPLADLNPEELQDKWLEPVQPWNQLPEDLVMAREHGKKLWAFLTKKRAEPVNLWVFVGKGRVPMSIALGVADVCNLDRDVIYSNDETGSRQDVKAPNGHVYSLVKATRNSVVT